MTLVTPPSGPDFDVTDYEALAYYRREPGYVVHDGVSGPASPAPTLPPWAASTSYKAGQEIWVSAGTVAVAQSTHLSGSTYAADKAAGKWVEVAGGGTYIAPTVNAISYGVVGNGVADDTTALQNAINACPAGGLLFIPRGRYKLTAALTIGTNMTIEGQGCAENFVSGASIDVPSGTPALSGTILLQTTAATDAIKINAAAVTVNLRKLGVEFDASIVGNTGHGINADPGTTGMSVVAFDWDDIAVYGHDGSHYGFRWINPLHGNTRKCRTYGGGGFYTGCTSLSGNYGNMVHIHPRAMVTATANPGFGHSSRTSTGGSGVLNLITYIRPQCNIMSGSGTQRTWDDTLGAGVPQQIVAVNVDMEGGGTSTGQARGAGTEWLGAGLQNRGDTHNTQYGYGSMVKPAGGSNTAFGDSALAAITSGANNTAAGYQAGQAATTGAQNVFVGSQAGKANDNSFSVMVGYNAGSTVTGWKNTFLGYQAGSSTAGVNTATAIGYNANASAAGAIAIGVDSAGTASTSTTQDVAAIGTALTMVQLLNNSTGAGSAALGANCPATTATAPYTWMKMKSGDGSTVYVPCWK